MFYSDASGSGYGGYVSICKPDNQIYAWGAEVKHGYVHASELGNGSVISPETGFPELGRNTKGLPEVSCGLKGLPEVSDISRLPEVAVVRMGSRKRAVILAGSRK